MTFITLKGEREGLTHKSDEYKNLVIEYMKSRGYALIGDSSNDSTLADLKFTELGISSQKETWAECKYAEISLGDKDFLAEMGKYFISYMQKQKGFYLYLFVKKCKNQYKWKKLFDPVKFSEDEVKKFHEAIIDSLDNELAQKFKGYSLDDFYFFINDAKVLECDYEDLLRNKTEQEKSKKFKVQDQLLSENFQLSSTTEIITSNILKIKDLPEKLWVVSLKNSTDADFWKTARGLFVYPKKGRLYCLNKLDNSAIDRYIDNKTWAEIKTSELETDKEENINLLKNFIKQFVIYKGQQIGLRYDTELECLFFNNKKLYYEYKKFGRQVAKVFPISFSEDDKYTSLDPETQFVRIPRKKHEINPNHIFKPEEVNFVRHNGINFYTDFFDGEFYIIFNMVILFTHDGSEIIRGENAKKIHYKFTEKFAYNSTELSKLRYWISILGFGNKSFSDANEFSISVPLEITATTSYKSGKKFDNNLLNYVSDDYDA